MLDFLQANSDAGGEQMGKWISATVARHTAWLITACSEFLVGQMKMPSCQGVQLFRERVASEAAHRACSIYNPGGVCTKLI